MATRVTWSGTADVRAGMDRYKRDARQALLLLALRFSAEIEETAKRDAPWEDRTGLARISLRSYVEQDEKTTAIYLSHGVFYGIFLETQRAGVNSIILPTLEKFYDPIKLALWKIFSRTPLS
jgi:hypothetical protein